MTVMTEQFHDRGVTLSASTLRSLDTTDGWPPGLRQCVHEYGYAIVQSFVQNGVTDPARIRELVTQCWNGARSAIDRPRSRSGSQRAVLNQLDWLLVQAGSTVTAATLLRVLRQSGLVVLPLSPSDAMVDASIDAVGGMGLVSKREKHRGRLRAALRAGAEQMWPQLFNISGDWNGREPSAAP